MATGKALDGKPYAGNPHVRFDEGEVAPAATPRRGSLLYRKETLLAWMVLAAQVVCAAGPTDSDDAAASLAQARRLTVETEQADGTCVREAVALVPTNGVAELRIGRGSVRPGTRAIRLRLDFARARCGEDGYFVTPNNEIGRFRHKDGRWRCGAKWMLMPVVGMKTPRVAFVAIGTGMPWSFSEEIVARSGEYAATLSWDEDLDAPYEDFAMRFVFLEGDSADYSGMARAYRAYQLGRGACRPLSGRAKERPELAYAATAPEIRIRQAWKPVPSPVTNQVTRNEPPVTPYVTFDRVKDIVRALGGAGVDKAEICLVGWNRGGHDGAYPQLFPVEPSLGGEAKLREAVRFAQDRGYRIVAHGNHRDAYMIADSWDAEYVREKNADGTLRPPATTWGGGGLYTICPQRAYERFAVKTAAEVAALGFRGLYYLDVATCHQPSRCNDPRHPLDKRQCRDYEAAILGLQRDTFGGAASEGAADAYMDVLDSALTVCWRKPFAPTRGLIDGYVPFWQLVYNGICLSTPFRSAMNIPVQEDAGRLALLLAEYGGRPTFYIYSRFREGGKAGNMGDRDLRCGTEEELAETVRAIRDGVDEYRRRSHLQFCFMDRHETISPGVVRISYSNGETMVCNYSDEPYEDIPPMSYRIRGDSVHAFPPTK